MAILLPRETNPTEMTTADCVCVLYLHTISCLFCPYHLWSTSRLHFRAYFICCVCAPFRLHLPQIQCFLSLLLWGHCLPLDPGDSKTITFIPNCLQDVKCLMAKICLQLNHNKTEVIVFGPPNITGSIASHSGPLSSNLHADDRTHGCHFWVKFDKQINSVL